MNGIRAITTERDRQVAEEGFDAAHDDAHPDGELVRAALAYAHAAIGNDDAARSLYPWDDEAPAAVAAEHVVASLAVAGALIAAEIDRIGREFPDQAAARARAVNRGSANGIVAEQVSGIARPWTGETPGSGAVTVAGDFADPPSGVQVVIGPGIVATYLLLGWDAAADDDEDGDTAGETTVAQHPAAYL